jgi:small subunit ribosomal protein S7
MPRRNNGCFLRVIKPDSKYNSVLVQKFINILMERGKKNIARAIVYDAMSVLLVRANGDESMVLPLFEKVLDAIKPDVEVKSRRVGGGVYQVPTQVRSSRAVALAIGWIIKAAQARNDKSMAKRLGKEFIEVLEGRGGAIKKKLDVHRMADANRAFSHYAW